MLLRSGYETKQTIKYDSNGGLSIASGWQFKKEKKQMSDKLREMGIEEKYCGDWRKGTMPSERHTKAYWIKYRSEELYEAIMKKFGEFPIPV